MILINIKMQIRPEKMDEWLALADSYAKDGHGFAAAVGPAAQQRLDAVRHPELVRRIAGGGRGSQAAGTRRRQRRSGPRLHGRMARAGRASCGQDSTQQQCGGGQVRTPGVGQPRWLDAAVHLVMAHTR